MKKQTLIALGAGLALSLSSLAFADTAPATTPLQSAPQGTVVSADSQNADQSAANTPKNGKCDKQKDNANGNNGDDQANAAQQAQNTDPQSNGDVNDQDNQDDQDLSTTDTE